MPDQLSPEPSIDEITKILEDKLHPTANTTPDSQQRYLGRYSFAALALNYFYYRAMKDNFMAILSILVSLTVFLLPLLLIFPIWARRRAYRLKPWQSFGEFESTQKKWDQAANYSIIVTIVVLYLLVRLLGPIYGQALQQIGGASNTNTLQQLNQLKNSGT